VKARDAINMIDAMIAAGVPIEQALAATKDAVAASEKPVMSPAERTRKWRERSKTRDESDVTNVTEKRDARDVTNVTATVGRIEKVQENKLGDARDVTNVTNVPTLRELELEQPKKTRDRRGKRISPDWQPTPEHVAHGAKLGFTAVQFDREAEKFRNHFLAASGSNAVKLDWDRAFTNWMLRGSERLPSNARPVPINAVVTTAAHAWVRRGSEQWNAWIAARGGKEPVTTFRGAEEGQYFRTEWPPPTSATA